MIKINKKIWIPILLNIKEALVNDDNDEAYHLLYDLVDPLCEKTFPWAEWEAFVAKEEVKNDKKSNL